MTYTTTEPANKNFLSPLGFNFLIHKTPNVNYFVQQVSIPGVTLGTATMPTPFQQIPIAGTSLTYGDLTLIFKIDEDLGNYLELYRWLEAISFPDDFGQYPGEAEVYSDATLSVLNSAYKVKHQFVFRELFPVDLSGFSMMSTASDVDHVECTATFRYRKFDVVAI